MMRRFADEAKPRRLIDAACGGQDVVGPERERAIAEFAGASDACGDQSAPDAGPAGAWLDIEEPEFRDPGGVTLHQENRANDGASAEVQATPGNALVGRVEFGDKGPERCGL